MHDRQSVMTMHNHTLHDRQWQVPGQEDSYTWLRMEGSAVEYDGSHSLTTNDRRWVLHGGGDIVRLSDGHGGSVRLGLMAQYGTSSGDTKGEDFRADHRVKGYSAGIYGTWFGNHDTLTGPYVDTWLMYGRFDNDVTGQQQLTESYRSNNTTMSVEAGYKFKLAESTTSRHFLEPQAQVIYSAYRANNHTTAGGSVLSDMSENNVNTRLGVRYSHDWLDAKGQTQMQGFVETNWWHGPSSHAMRIDDNVVRESLPADRMELKIGVQGDIMKNLSVNSAISVGTNTSSYTAGRISVGINYAW